MGRIIARKYQLVRLLGQGGMGAVYEGRNTATLKRCAVKLLLSPELGANAELVKRFFREAKASSIIESDHIVQVYDSGYDGEVGWPYMVMEMLSGEDLEKTVARMGALQPIAAAKLILQATIGLARAHEAGIIHRDIKPANLYLTRRDAGDLLVKVLDFGIAKVKMENLQETSNGLTRTGSMLGTPLYMSPEQVNGASNIDARSDVWSLGIVLFELLSGSIPWNNTSSLGRLMAAILTEDVPLLQDRAPWVPPELAEIVHRAISRDMRQRYANCGEFRDALMAIVPDGPRITPEVIQSVPEEFRAYTAPRLALSDDGMLRATTRTGLTTHRGTKKSGSSLALGAFVVLAIVGGGGVFAYRALTPHTAPEPLSSTKGETPAPTASTPAPTVVPVPQRFELLVGPPGVTITVDGLPTEISDGKVEIMGALGDTRQVALTFKGKSEEHVVGITQAGVVPGKIEFAKTVEQKPLAGGGRARAQREQAGSASTPKASPATETRPQPKKDTGLVRDTGEF